MIPKNPPKPSPLWFILLGEQLAGPFDDEQLKRLIRFGKITRETMLTRDKMTYVPAGECLEGSWFQGQQAALDKGTVPPTMVTLAPQKQAQVPDIYPAHGNYQAGVQAPITPAVAQQVDEHYEASRSVTDASENTCRCPHCWTLFPLEDVLFVAVHPDLLGDTRLGSGVAARFRATRFTPQRHAIDRGGMRCSEMACPNCHLVVPRSVMEMRPEFFSFVGATGSGKSYYLAGLTWKLRQTLDQDFGFSFTDAETVMNQLLHGYEETLFQSADPEQFVTLEKTQLEGQLYSSVNFGGQPFRLPKPFVFCMRAKPHNPVFNSPRRNCRSIILYDNAGEHFQPNADIVRNPCNHLVHSRCLFFILDPTRNAKFQAIMKSTDPQMSSKSIRIERQDVLINEAARRIRRHEGIPMNKKLRKPLVVIVSKFDIWRELIKLVLRRTPYIRAPKVPVSLLDAGHIADVSFSVRDLLMRVCPEVVSAAEDMSDDVTYIPVSALGHSPTEFTDPDKPGQKRLLVRPVDIAPFWVAIPFLYALSAAGYIHAHAIRPQGVEEARLVRRFPGVQVCGLSDRTEIAVPEKYAGKALHHPQTNLQFIVPELHHDDEEQDV